MKILVGRHFRATVCLIFQMVVSEVRADTSIGTLNLSGNVPTIFSVTAYGYPGDLDLNGNTSVASDRLVGFFHFRYNADIASLTLQAAQATGLPSTAGGVAYNFGTSFMLKFGTCNTIHATYKVAFSPGAGATSLAGAGKDIKSAATSGLTAGVEETCELMATWGGTAHKIPLAGKYTLDLTLTMVSI